ncbi:hypothetical protein EDB87DRAFT_1676120 [Lactarius vividus]|nr:hypothetical protein EDB87DRAFT_1676120 [Lactarius vividus]
MGQVVLTTLDGEFPQKVPSLWTHPLLIPSYLALLSIVVLLAQAIFSSGPVQRLRDEDAPVIAIHGESGVTASATRTGFVSAVKDHVEKSGGSVIFFFQVLRLVVVLTLLGLAIFSFVQEEGQRHVSLIHHYSSGSLTKREWLDLTLCLTYLYAAILGLMTVASFHLSLLLFGILSVYAYRNIWPLLTFTLSPVDSMRRIGLLAFVAIAIPLLIPYQYIPIDPKDPQQVINPEQTASLLSMMLYTFLDHIVFLAYRVPHLPYDMLPPLADYDYTRNLVRRSFKYLDTFSGGPRRHIFWGFMAVFRREYIQLAIFVVIKVFSTLMAPIGMNQLLRIYFSGYLLFGTIAYQWYIFIATGNLVRVTAIVTQLVFEHALRIRVKAETSSSSEAMLAATPEVGSEATTPDSGSVVEINIVSEGVGGNARGIRATWYGKMNNLVSTDLENLLDGRDFLLLILYFPLQMVICVCFLYNILGWSAFAGNGSDGTVAGKIQKIQRETVKRLEKREQELQILVVINGNIKWVFPMVVTYVTYTAIMKRALTPSAVFSSMAVFDIIRNQLQTIFWMIPMFIRARVSLDRVNDFLHHTELLDEFADAEKGSERVMLMDASHFDQDVIGFQNASFTWTNEDPDGTLTPSRRRFTLRVQGELLFKRGCFNLIIGPTGSGKTSLLMALLGEMHFVPIRPDSWYHLPRQGGVSYAAQESWVQNETIRDNILFGAPYDEERYNKVIYQCGLQRDISLFDAGDKTEVGEKGLTLSGGQKARVTLARAVYSSSQILILDDVLAALDVHTARWIVEKCFKGDLIRGRTILLVTHNVAMATPLADYVVSLGKDGLIASRGSVSDALKMDETLANELAEGTRAIKDEEEEIDSEEPDGTARPADGKLILAEEISEGNVSWDAVKLFINGLGGAHPVLFWIAYAGGMLLLSTLMTVQTWFMGYWAEQYDIYQPEEVNITFYITVYVLILLVATASYTTGFGVYMFGALRASRTIHRTLIEWLDTTPTSRVITRVTQDIRALDGPLADTFSWVIDISAAMLLKFIAVVYFTPVFSVPGIVIAILGAWLGRVYMKAQIAIKREMSNAKAPVLGHFGASVAGLTSIRAYGAQVAFREESYRRIDRYSRAARSFYNMNRWINLRIDFLGGLLSASLAAYLIYVPNEHSLPSDTGFSLTMARLPVGFSGLILWWVRHLNSFEVAKMLIGATYSLERMHSYINAEQEPKPTEQGTPPAHWPASGDLRVEKLSARYSYDGPKVLHDISFHIKSGERVGVVGRTGSGKSSLTLSLLRCIFTEGSVHYDDKLTSSINLDALRSNITIIPQIVRTPATSLRALHASGLFSLQNDDEGGRLTLDSQIASGGGNLSVGQRQILALARAIVRDSKLLILDEDYKTDTIIQTSLRTELKRDTTLIIVAHRLQTIIDADKVVEFDKPRELLKMENGRFRSLVDESEDRDLLYLMASSSELDVSDCVRPHSSE